jgi:H+-transporting ATPase
VDLTAIDLDTVKTVPILNVLSKLTANLQSGLFLDGATRRLHRYSYNEISERQKSPLIKFLSYIRGPIPWTIEIAAVFAAVSIAGRIGGLFSCSWW